jgi:hypothetical protein
MRKNQNSAIHIGDCRLGLTRISAGEEAAVAVMAEGVVTASAEAVFTAVISWRRAGAVSSGGP